MKDLDPVGVDTRRGRALRRCLYYGIKVPAGYGILIVMTSLSPLGLRARGVLMETVDAYYG